MAEADKVSESDRMEQASLQRVVADAERSLASMPPGTRPFFNGFLLNAKARLGVLDKKILDAERENLEHARNEAAVAALAQQESRLTRDEKEEYSGFLAKRFFSRQDFAQLERFYRETWDRLSERGKDEMSQRIWEGIRHDQYKFSDLPQAVQEKEADRAYAVLKRREAQAGAPNRIPTVDRDDFIRAYENGRRKDASVILDRPSFRESMLLGTDSAPIRNSSAEVGKETEAARMRESSAASPADADARPLPSSRAKANLDASGVKLDGLVLTAADEVSVPGLPNTGPPKSRG